jgi:hypothetical protein
MIISCLSATEGGVTKAKPQSGFGGVFATQKFRSEKLTGMSIFQTSSSLPIGYAPYKYTTAMDGGVPNVLYVVFAMQKLQTEILTRKSKFQ